MAERSKPDLDAMIAAIGDPAEEVAKMRRFQATARNIFSCKDPRLLDKHKGKWVGAYDSKIVASEDTFETVLQRLDELNVPRGETIVRYIEPVPRTFIF